MRSTRAVVGVALAVLLGAACGGSSSSSDNNPPKTKYALTVDLAGAGTGKVTSTVGIDCGQTCSAQAADEVALTAVADAGSAFVGWHGACVGMRNPCAVKVTAAASVTASFTKGGSGLPVPNGGGKAAPTGTAGGLKVLDWAGFDAAITYTFDDGLTSQTANYPALKATGVPMTFFVVPQMVQKNVEAWKQMRADGQEMGNHTHGHCKVDGGLHDCSWGPALATPELEISEASKFITETLGQNGVWSMAAPFGDTKWEAYAQAAHFLTHRDVNPQGGVSFASPGQLERQFGVPSFYAGVQYGGNGYTTEWLDGDIDSTVKGNGWGVFLFHAIGKPPAKYDVPEGQKPVFFDDPTKTWVDPDAEGCCETPLENIVASIDYAQGSGKVWVGRMVDVGAYWVGQKLFNDVTPTTSGNATTWKWTLPENFPNGKYLRVTVAGGTLSQGGQELAWDEHGYYEVALDAGELTLMGTNAPTQQYDCTLVTGTSASQYGNTGVGLWFEYTSADFLAAATAGDPYVASVDVFVPTSASEVPPDLRLTANRANEASLFTNSSKVTKGSWQSVSWTISPDTASQYWAKLADKDVNASFIFSTSAENQAVTFCYRNFTIANKAGAVADLKLNTGYVSLGSATFANGHM